MLREEARRALLSPRADLVQLTGLLSLVLAHDLLLSKKGIALPAKHGLHAAISRHKARLASELTKARLKRKCASLEALRGQVNAGASGSRDDGTGYVHPRWVRINTLLTTLEMELETTFAEFRRVETLADITWPKERKAKLIYLDPNIPNLVAVPGNQDLSSSHSYKEGRLIFQEKASCFPACLTDPTSTQSDIIDACAAPGNKTTHLAALLENPTTGRRRNIYACEKDAARSDTLTKMVRLAGAAELVTVKAKQDFMKLDLQALEFANVEALLLDPSCSGSGIIGRDEARVTIHLPSRGSAQALEAARGKKRKRTQTPAEVKLDTAAETDTMAEEAAPSANEEDASKLATRLANLSFFQLRLLQHAMAFPSAKRITYSTCSLHKEEDEYVVVRALLSDVARERGWKVLRREKQVEGMRDWKLRGSREAVDEALHDEKLDVKEVGEACIRCEKGGEGGTMGFFVAAFVRDDGGHGVNDSAGRTGAQDSSRALALEVNEPQRNYEDEEWEGFSDEDG